MSQAHRRDDRVIRPTHHCFDDALELINDLLLERPDRAHDPALGLVHGIAVGNGQGVDVGHRYAHAWVEDGDLCWDSGLLNGQRIYFPVTRDKFYASRGIVQTTRYSIEQAWLENVRSGHYGPWQPEYRALCKGQGD